jgi:hypothetical protein
LNRNELELKRLTIQSFNLSKALELTKHLITCVCVGFCIWVMFQGLEQMARANASSLNAFASVVRNMQLGSLMGYVVAAATSGGWYYERQGKKRAIRKLGQSRRAFEKGDPNNASSGLTETGETPSE